MADVVSVTMLPDDRATFEDAEQRRHTISWHVLLDEVVENGSDIARSATGIPVVKPTPSSYPGDPFAVCRTVAVDPVEGNRLLFKVVANYSTAIVGPPGEGGPSDNPDPTQRPADVSWSFEVDQTYYQRDLDGNPFINSAQQPFDVVPSIDNYILVLNVTKNEATYDAGVAYDYIGTINDAAGELSGLTVGVGECLCTQISAARFFESGISYWQISYQFKIRASEVLTVVHSGEWDAPASETVRGWDCALLDAGYAKFTASGVEAIVGSDGQPVTAPWPLDGTGDVAINPIAAYATLTTPVYVVFRVFEEKDFSVFNFFDV